MTTHDLKTWPEYFEAVESGAKSFEVRWNDRDYRTGDVLRLREWHPGIGKYSGRECTRVVTYVLNGGCWGIQGGYVVMGLEANP